MRPTDQGRVHLQTMFLWITLHKMKLLSPALLIALAVSVMAQTSSIYDEGVNAYKRGDYASARSFFQAVLAEKPGDKAATNYLRLITAREGAAAGLPIEASLKSIVIPKIEFQSVSVQEAVAFVAQQIQKISKDQTTLNVVWVATPNPGTTVTLSLQEIPASEALKYIAEVAGLDLAYDARALKIKPLAP